jgi:hypothetical protein
LHITGWDVHGNIVCEKFVPFSGSKAKWVDANCTGIATLNLHNYVGPTNEPVAFIMDNFNGRCVGLGGDTDGDGVCDSIGPNTVADNCRDVPNPSQADFDLDGVGDACDNCPKVANADQATWPGSTNLLGKACDPGGSSLVICPNPPCPTTIQPGAPAWYDLTFTNKTGNTIQTIRPDCYNVLYQLTDLGGVPVEPSCRLRVPYEIPKDVVTIANNAKFTVRCDFSEQYPAATLPAGLTSGTLFAHYWNYIQDPDVVPLQDITTPAGCKSLTGDPTDPGTPCTDLFMGIIRSQAVPVAISGTPATKYEADVVFSPSAWDVAWAQGGGPVITATISNIVNPNDPTDTLSVAAIDCTTIVLNGNVTPIQNSFSRSGGALSAKFSASEAVSSPGSISPGTMVPVKIQARTTGATPKFIDGPSSVDLVNNLMYIPHGALTLQADLHTVGPGKNPADKKTPIIGMNTYVFSKSKGSCAAGYGVSWQNYPAIVGNCPAVSEISTNKDGQAKFILPVGDYIVIGLYTDTGGEPIYPGVSVGAITSGSDVRKYVQVIKNGAGKNLPAKYQVLTGSELLVIEPEYVEWSSTTELYPFVFQSIGDWGVTTAVTPPKGFVADYPALSTQVNTEIKAVQFTVTDVGSDWVSTKVKYKIQHKGKEKIIDSTVGIKLSPELAKIKKKSIYGDEPPPKGTK